MKAGKIKKNGTMGLVLWLLLALSSASWGGQIEGRIVAAEQPLAGMVVVAYPTLDPSTEPLARSEPSDEEGYYQLTVPETEVALYSRDQTSGYFAFCGRNPLVVDKETVWAGLQAVRLSQNLETPYDDEFSAGVEGRITFQGKPVSGAYVYLYLDVEDGLKGQGYRLSMPTGEDGFFALDGLPESSYFLVARKRQSGESVGPVSEGDLLGIFPGNPLALRAGKLTEVELPLVRKIKNHPGKTGFKRGTGLQVSGIVMHSDGTPVQGLHAFAYTDRVIGHQKPVSMSTPTGPDGRFSLSFEKPGVYYLGARQNYGDSPAPGELFGMYDKSADHGLEVTAEAQLEVTIVVTPVDLQ